MPTPIFPLSTATWRNPNEGKNKTRSGTQTFEGEREEAGGGGGERKLGVLWEFSTLIQFPI